MIGQEVDEVVLGGIVVTVTEVGVEDNEVVESEISDGFEEVFLKLSTLELELLNDVENVLSLLFLVWYFLSSDDLNHPFSYFKN